MKFSLSFGSKNKNSPPEESSLDAPSPSGATKTKSGEGTETLDTLEPIQNANLSAEVAPEAPAPAFEVASVGHLGHRQDRSLFKTLMDSLYDATLIVDPKGCIIANNGRAEEFFGHHTDSFWNLPCETLVTGFNRRVLTQISSHVASGRFTVLNTNCLRKDGSSFPAEIAISQIHYLNEGDLLMTIRSLERRKKAEERRDLERDAARYSCIGLMVCRRDGLIEYVNPPLLHLLKLEDDHQALQRFLGDFCESQKACEHILHTPSITSTWMGKAPFRTGPDQTAEFSISSAPCPQRKDGSSRVIVSLTPLPRLIG